RVAKLGTLQVDNDVVRDRIGWAQELDFVANDVQNAAALDAGGQLFVLEMNRNVDSHDRVLADAQEVDVQRHVLHAIKLVFLRQRADGLAIHFDVENGRGEAAAVDAVVDFLSGNRDGKRGLLVAVNNGWNFSFAANCTGGPLTDPFARLGLKRRALAHGIFLSVAG